MERDRRLTGSMRGQTDNAVAPAGFELSSAWKVPILSLSLSLFFSLLAEADDMCQPPS